MSMLSCCLLHHIFTYYRLKILEVIAYIIYIFVCHHFKGTCLDLGKCNLGVTSEIHEELGNMIFVDSRVHARIGEKKFGKITIKITIKGVVFPQGIQNDKEFVTMKTRSRQERVEIDTG